MNNFVKWFIFRFVMSSLNISGRRIIDMETVEEMIKAVDDGDGQLEYDEFIQLLKKWKNVVGKYLSAFLCQEQPVKTRP